MVALPPLPHLPLLRAGRPYRSLDVAILRDIRTGEPVAEVSQASAGMISRDARQGPENRRILARKSSAELVDICHKAAEFFLEGELPLGDGVQTRDDYLRQLAATTGMPVALGRSNMDKIYKVLAQIEAVLDGLTRGLDLSILDQGWGEQDSRRLSFLAQTEALGAVLPNNSPGVHTLWLPAIPLKMPLVLRPGSAEPWTPYRIAQALLAAGCPPKALSLYPSSHVGGTQVLLSTGRSMIFGDQSTIERWSRDIQIQAHGPGWSKILVGPDQADRWQDHLELMADSVLANGGRSCINTSSIRVPAHGREVAEALARRLVAVEARGLEDPRAELAAFADARVAHLLSEKIDQDLQQAGAEDLTAQLRSGNRVVEVGGCTFVLPTVIFCQDPEHKLTQAEYGFPFVTVVEASGESMLGTLGPTLVASVVTEDESFRRRVLECEAIDRLNFGPIPTYRLSWDQPHEGNLFEHLYRQRAFQAA